MIVYSLYLYDDKKRLLGLGNLMFYCILFCWLAIALWLGIKTRDEVHPLALTATALTATRLGLLFQSSLVTMC